MECDYAGDRGRGAEQPQLPGALGAIVQVAVFEAVNSIVGDYEPYLGVIDAPADASPDAAAIAAAYCTLVTLRPASAPVLDPLRAASLAAIPDGPEKEAGILVGEEAAAAILLLRINDGWDAVVPYTPGTNPGDWPPAPPAFAPASHPHWGLVASFALEVGSQFRLPAPPALHTGGIHFRFEQEAGAHQGRHVGRYIVRNYLRSPEELEEFEDEE